MRTPPSGRPTGLVRAFSVTLALTAALSTILPAQRSSGISLGIHGGLDVSDENKTAILGAQLAFHLPRGLRIQLAGTSVVEGVTNLWYASSSLEWTLPQGTVRPFAGAGLALEYGEIGSVSDTEVGWLALGGFKIPIRRVMPFVEIRLLGVSGTLTQLLIGFESRLP